MRKTLLGLIALVLTAFSFTAVSPAHAATTEALNCVYSGPNVDRTDGTMTVFITSDNRIQADVTFHDGKDRDWTWKFNHNGDLSAGPNSAKGGFSVSRTFYNFTGPDSIHFNVVNAASTVECNSTISI